MKSCRGRPWTTSRVKPVIATAAGFMYVHCWRASIKNSAAVALSVIVWVRRSWACSACWVLMRSLMSLKMLTTWRTAPVSSKIGVAEIRHQ